MSDNGDAHGSNARVVTGLFSDLYVEEYDNVRCGDLVWRVLVIRNVPRPGEGAEDRG